MKMNIDNSLCLTVDNSRANFHTSQSLSPIPQNITHETKVDLNFCAEGFEEDSSSTDESGALGRGNCSVGRWEAHGEEGQFGAEALGRGEEGRGLLDQLKVSFWRLHGVPSGANSCNLSDSPRQVVRSALTIFAPHR
jgi:hypothetical protein